MAELGETGDPRALVPGDPVAVADVQAAMARLGAGLLAAGDGLRRIDVSGWTGEAADAFRAAADVVPAQWTGTGEAFVDAADALADHQGVLAWAQDEAARAVTEWERATDDVGRRTAGERLAAARAEVARSGDATATVVGRARDLAPPSPSLAARVGSVVGDVAAGAWDEVAATGRFLWQIDPARFLVEPREAARGWSDLGSGLVAGAEHPDRAAEAAVDAPDARTNPARWAGGIAAALALSSLAGAGLARRGRAVAEAGRIADALAERDNPGPPGSAPPVGRYEGRTAAEHVANQGADIGRPGSGKRTKQPTREVDSSEEVERLYRTLSEGGRVVRVTGGLEVTQLPDGTFLTFRREAQSTPGGAALDLRDAESRILKVHVPRPGDR